MHGCEWCVYGCGCGCVYRCGCGCMGVSGVFIGVGVGAWV